MTDRKDQTPAEEGLDRQETPPTADLSEDAHAGALLPGEAADSYRERWKAIQATFVDEPRTAVSDADGMVGEVMDRLRASFEDQRKDLESGWSGEETDSSTEDLRVAFRRYRSFFERLLDA